MKGLGVGDPAPDITLQSHTGEAILLADFVGKRVVVLFFYPKDGSPVCTKEVCAFRDAYQAFVDAGAEVLGVSSDAADAHRAFAKQHGLPFKLLVDKDGELRKAFGVPKALGLLPGRVTYVIDTDGVIRHTFKSHLHAERHVSEALAVVRRLAAAQQ